ncbi:MAG: thiamine-phosphate kinase [Phycisphaeraceae bacterium]|nr:thiamine-phosphate kinase [Phycisphaeraceae bacterium]
MRESDLLAHIYGRSGSLAALDPDIIVGPGDDCAVVRSHSGDPLLLKVDQLVESRHFAPDTPIDLIARKAIARTVSDIAAMAGSPRWGLAAALLPHAHPHADALFDAMARWARHFGCPLVGGDIAMWGADHPAPRLSLTVTIVGQPIARPILRSGARPGDDLYVTGKLGNALASGRHLSFEPRLREVADLLAALGDSLHAMMDLSDGLGRDAGRMALASGTRIEIDAPAIPRSDGLADWRRAASDGEDYELLFAAAPGAPVPDRLAGTPVTRIGRVTPGHGCVALEPGTPPIDISTLGYDHADH